MADSDEMQCRDGTVALSNCPRCLTVFRPASSGRSHDRDRALALVGLAWLSRCFTTSQGTYSTYLRLRRQPRPERARVHRSRDEVSRRFTLAYRTWVQSLASHVVVRYCRSALTTDHEAVVMNLVSWSPVRTCQFWTTRHDLIHFGYRNDDSGGIRLNHRHGARMVALAAYHAAYHEPGVTTCLFT